MSEPADNPNSRTAGPSHAESRWAQNVGGAAELLARELEEAVAAREHAAGRVGNAVGKLRAAEHAVEEARLEYDRLEERARRLRLAMNVLRASGAFDAGEAHADVPLWEPAPAPTNPEPVIG